MRGILLEATNTSVLYLKDAEINYSIDESIKYNIVIQHFNKVIYKSKRIKQKIKINKNGDYYIKVFKTVYLFKDMQPINV